MVNWCEHWSTYPKQFDDTAYLQQVGKTVNGEPISEHQFQHILDDIEQRLQLKPDDNVLDLCCGNGLITQKIAARCANVVGVDFSEPLLAVARKHHKPDNVTYHQLSVLELDKLGTAYERYFDKVLMYEALQHFSEDSLTDILQHLLIYVKPKDAIIVFGSVPNKARIWDFYNTPARRQEYFIRQANGTEAIGTWWSEVFIRQTCASLGLEAKFHRQHKALHTSHYRFDISCHKENPEKDAVMR